MEYQRKQVGIDLFKEYTVDTNGIVYGKNGRPMNPSRNPQGYLIAQLSVDGIGYAESVHRLVAKTFIKNDRTEATEINHKDGNKLNNNVDNLEWVTREENRRHAVDVLGVGVGVNNSRAKAIRGVSCNMNDVICFEAIADAARYIKGKSSGAAETTIWKALTGRLRTAYGYKWEYV